MMFHDVSQCFMRFYYVQQCLVSRTTIGIAASATADCDNGAGISDNAAGIVNIAVKVIPR